MNDLWRSFRFSLRRLWKAPGFTALVVFPLAFGIGANSAIFSIVDSVLLRPLPYRQPERLVALWETEAKSNGRDDLSPPNYRDLVQQSSSFSQLGASTPYWSVNLTGVSGPEKLKTELVTASLFRVLGVKPFLGTVFADADDLPGGKHSVVLGHGLWQRRFGGDPHVLGSALTIDGQPYTVIGVMPAGFYFLTPQTDVYLPLSYAGDRLRARAQYFLRAVGRLAPGISVKQAWVEAATIGTRLAREYPGTNAGRGFGVAPLQETVVGGIRPTLMVLLGVVGFVLLIACANVANLMSVRAVGRQREVALRSALGASRRRILGELAVESAVLALAGGGLGLLLATWGVRFFARSAPAGLPRAHEIGIGGPVVLFTLALSLLAAVLSGLLPALQRSRTELHDALKQGDKGATGGASKRFRDLLVVVEVTLAIVLLIGAGVMIKSFVYLRSIHPGFDPHRVLTFDLVLPDSKYTTYQQRQQFFEQLADSLATLPSVTAVGGINYLPFGEGSASSALTVEGHPTPPGAPVPSVDIRTVTSGYFVAMRIPLLAGRTFGKQDRRGAPKVVLVNQPFRDRFFAGQDPLGKRIQLGAPSTDSPWLTIAGVVGPVRAHGLAADPSPEVYVHLLQSTPQALTMVLRTGGDPAQLATAARRQVWAVDPDLPVSNVTTLEERLAGSIARERLLMLLFGIFAVVALTLGLVGVYGVMSYSVAQRTREIGIRMALGAQRQQVLREVVTQALALALAGLAGGLIAAAALSHFLASMVHGIAPTDPAIFAGIAALMLVAALLAALLPARRAMRVDPLVALRFE